jgi:hypothetical protein
MLHKLAITKTPKIAKAKTKLLTTKEDINAVAGAYVPLTQTLKYFNHLGIDMIVLHRDGTRFIIPPMGGGAVTFSHGFTIVKSYMVNDTVIIDSVTLSNELSESEQIIRKALENKRRTSIGSYAFDIQFTIDKELLRQYDDCLYIHELDIVIMTGRNERAVHPYSESGVVNSLKPKTMEQFCSGVGFKWITHINTRETRYMNFHGDIITIQSIYNPSMEEGFYLFSQGFHDEDTSRVKRMTIDEAMKKFNLKGSLYEAQNVKSAEDVVAEEIEFIKGEQRKEVAKLEYELKLAQNKLSIEATESKIQEVKVKQGATMEEHNYDAERRAVEREYLLSKLKLDADKAQMEMELYREKFKMEMQSANRKDTSEFIKWIPALIPALLLGVSVLTPK